MIRAVPDIYAYQKLAVSQGKQKPFNLLTTRRWPSHCAVQTAWSFAWGLPGSTARMEATLNDCYDVIDALSIKCPHDR